MNGTHYAMFVVVPSEPTVLVPVTLQFLLDAALVLTVELVALTAPCNNSVRSSVNSLNGELWRDYYH